MNRREAMAVATGSGMAAVMMTGLGPAAQAAAPADGIVSQYVTTTDATRLFIRDWGRGQPVLFLSGWTLPSDFWGYQMLALAQEGYRVIAYDRRGHGRSDDPGRGYDHDTLADDLATVIGSLGAEAITIVAHSMGATEVARYFTRHRGKGVARIVLVGGITPFLMKTDDNPHGLDKSLLASLRAPLAQDFPGWIAANTPPFFLPETSPDMMAWGKSMMLQTSLLAAAQLAKANAETDFRADLRAIPVPALVIHGDKDASAPLPLTAQPTAALIPNARLEIYEGAPHGLPLTHIGRLNSDLLSFLGRK